MVTYFNFLVSVVSLVSLVSFSRFGLKYAPKLKITKAYFPIVLTQFRRAPSWTGLLR